jgi:hypothetical protein
MKMEVVPALFEARDERQHETCLILLPLARSAAKFTITDAVEVDSRTRVDNSERGRMNSYFYSYYGLKTAFENRKTFIFNCPRSSMDRTRVS